MELGSGIYIFDKNDDSYANVFKAEQILYNARSEFQKIMVFETKEMGNVLMLDDIFNVSHSMEAYYHEPMTHIPLAMIPGDKNVLIIGGGDFGIAKHVLKHKSLKSLTLCELDPEILKVCRTYFPEWAECENDPRFNVMVGDGFEYINNCEPDTFDAVIIDSTDPYLHDSPLITEEFYRRAFNAIRSGGVLMQIIADFIFFKDTWFDMIPKTKKYFTPLAPISLPIPFYATGAWGLLLAGKNRDELDPEHVSAEYLDGIGGVQTMTPELVKGWFSLPPVLEKEFRTLLL